MADLGVPQYIPTTSVPSGNDAVEIAAGVASIAQSASDVIVDAKEAQLARDLADIASAGVQQVEDPALAQDPEARTYVKNREQALFHQLRGYQAQAAQSSGSVRNAVINKAKRRVYEALRDNPALHDNMKNEFNEFMAYNPDLDYLASYDAGASSQQAMAQKQMQLIFDKAYESVQNGGYGIPASIPFGSEEFVRRWFEKEDADTMNNNRLFLLNTIDSEAEYDLEKSASIFDEAVMKSNNAIDGYFQTVYAQGLEMTNISKRIANGQASSEEQEIYNLWQLGGAEEAVRGFDQFKLQFEHMKTQVPPSARNSERGKNYLAQLDDQIGYINRWQAAFEGMSENPTLVELMNIESEIRQTKWRERFPAQDKMVFRMKQVQPLLEYAEVIGLKDVMAKDLWGNLTIDGINDYIVDSLTFGAEGLDNATSLSPEEVRRSVLRNKDSASGAPYGTGTDQSKGQSALQKIETSVLYDANAFKVYQQIGKPEEALIYDSMAGQVAHVNELTTGNQFHPTTVARIAELYGDTSTPQMVSAIRGLENQPAKAVAIAALGEELANYMVAMPGGMNGQIANLSKDLNRNYGSSPLMDLIYVDYDDLDKGIVNIKVKNDAENRVLMNDPTMPTYGPDAIRRTRRELERTVQDIEDRLNNLLRFSAHVDFYKNMRADKPRYAITFENYGFNQLFGPIGGN